MSELDELKKTNRILRKILKVLLLPYKTYEDGEHPVVPAEE